MFVCAQLFVTPWSVPTWLLCPWDFPDMNTGVGCHSLPGDLPDPGIKPGSPALQPDSLLSEPQGKPIYPKRYQLDTFCDKKSLSQKRCRELAHVMERSPAVGQSTGVVWPGPFPFLWFSALPSSCVSLLRLPFLMATRGMRAAPEVTDCLAHSHQKE